MPSARVGHQKHARRLERAVDRLPLVKRTHRFRDSASDRDRFGDRQPPVRLQARRERLAEQRGHGQKTRAVLGHAVLVDDHQLLAASTAEHLDRAAQPLVELLVEGRLGQDFDRDLAAGGDLHAPVELALIPGVHAGGKSVLAPDPWRRFEHARRLGVPRPHRLRLEWYRQKRRQTSVNPALPC
jgi:hypothetical protein